MDNRAVTCVYKHVVPVTRRTSEDVTPIMEEEANIITDDQFSTVEEVPQVVDSDSTLTDKEKKSMICIWKKNNFGYSSERKNCLWKETVTTI